MEHTGHTSKTDHQDLESVESTKSLISRNSSVDKKWWCRSHATPNSCTYGYMGVAITLK
jgi:hypothetical protein